MAEEVMDEAIESSPIFHIGAVFGRGTTVFFRLLPSNFLLVAVPLLLTPIVMLFLFLLATRIAGLMYDRQDMAGPMAAILLILYPIAILVLRVIVVARAFRAMSGEKSNLGRTVRDVIVRLPSLVVAEFLAWIAVALGWAALAVPGVILFVMTSVVLPVSVIEGRSPLSAIDRSLKLTRFCRWRILLLCVVEWLAFLVISGIANNVILDTTKAGLVLPAAVWWGVAILGYAVYCLALVFAAVIDASLYYGLRMAKDGPIADRLAAVFD